MIRTPFRFLHASDLSLELPIEGIGGDASSIEHRILSAPQEAARRLFQYAKAEVVDFVLLSGNVVDPNASGPGPLVFLVEQFEMLNKLGIPVYWAGSDHDGPEHWPTAIHLPDNVHFFRTASVEEFILHKDDLPVVRLIGMSRGNRHRILSSTEFAADSSGLYTIVVANGQVDSDSVQYSGIPFWALGGSKKRWTAQLEMRGGQERRLHSDDPATEQRKTAKAKKATELVHGNSFEYRYTNVHYPGRTLARSADEQGEYGATLVDVDVYGNANLTFLPTSPVRWIYERIELEAGANLKALRTAIQKRIGSYRTQKSRDDLFISWIVDCPGGTLPSDLRNGAVTEQLLEEMRIDFGVEPPICWSVSITTSLPDVISLGLHEQRTVLNAYIQAIHQLQQHPYEPLNLLQFLPKDFRELPFGHQLPLSLPHEMLSDSILKRLMFDDSKKELTPVEQVQLDNLRKKIRDAHRQEQAFTAVVRDKNETHEISIDGATAAEKRVAKKEKSKINLKLRKRQTEKILKQLRIRQRILRNVLKEAAILGWDLLGNENAASR